jgi:hypothetical protein
MVVKKDECVYLLAAVHTAEKRTCMYSRRKYILNKLKKKKANALNAVHKKYKMVTGWQNDMVYFRCSENYTYLLSPPPNGGGILLFKCVNIEIP